MIRDPITNQMITPAMAKLMAIDPDAGLAMQKNAMVMQESQAKLQNDQLTHAKGVLDLISEPWDNAHLAYDDAIKKGASPEAANAAGQRVLDDEMKTVDASGALSESDRDNLKRKFDPMLYQSLQQRKDQVELQLRDAQIVHETASTAHENVETAKAGLETSAEARQLKGLPDFGEDAQTAAAQEYRAKGIFPPGASPEQITSVLARANKVPTPAKDFGPPVPVTVKGDDGKEKTIEALYDKDNAQWVTAQGRKPIDGDVLPATEARKEAGAFSPRMGDLMAALAEQGVSLPTGFRSKEQQQALYGSLLDRHPDLPAEEIAKQIKTGQIEFAAQKKETQTAAGIAGKVEVAQNELSEFIPLVREASTKVPRGKFVPINQLLQMGEASISDPDLKQLRIYINSTLNAYDVLAGRGGTDKDKREEAHKLLTSAESPQALEAGLKAFQNEADAAHRAAVKATKVPELEDAGAKKKAEAPAGVDPDLWKYLTPEEQKLWVK